MNQLTLDEAWAAVEAVLPEMWHVDGVGRLTAGEWQAWAWDGQEPPEEGDAYGMGDTPVAALLALADELRKMGVGGA